MASSDWLHCLNLSQRHTHTHTCTLAPSQGVEPPETGSRADFLYFASSAPRGAKTSIVNVKTSTTVGNHRKLAAELSVRAQSDKVVELLCLPSFPKRVEGFGIKWWLVRSRIGFYFVGWKWFWLFSWWVSLDSGNMEAESGEKCFFDCSMETLGQSVIMGKHGVPH